MIYVDAIKTYNPKDARTRRHGTEWCHMVTDGDLGELHEFAIRLGLKRTYFQGTGSIPHYDLTPSKRALAVARGAVQISSKHLVAIFRAKRPARRRGVPSRNK